MKCKMWIAVVIMTIIGCSGCSRGQNEVLNELESGGYAEKIVELPVQTVFTELVQDNEEIRLVDIDYKDMVSEDRGEHFQEKGDAVTVATSVREYMAYALKADSKGNRIFYTYVDGERICMLATVDGRLIKLKNISMIEESYPKFYYGAGYFYVVQGNSIYQVNIDTGETEFLVESAGYPLYLAAEKDMVYIVCQEGILLYNLEKREIMAQQDEILSSFVSGRSDILIYPCGNGIYVAAYEGVYWHEVYGDSMEQLVDGSTCGLGNRDRDLAGMAVVENHNGRKSFLIYCSDGVLLRYDYDDDFVPAQNVVRVYSLYEDSQIKRGIIAFREKYPNIVVKYEIGINGSYGMTEEDALKNLAMELAAGAGPDILIMDDIPYHSYIEKGVLTELTEIRGGMEEEEYFTHIVDSIRTKDGLYMVPVSFVIPVLAGMPDEIKGIESLPELADLLESVGNENGGCVIGVVNEEEVLGLLAQSSMGAWVSAERIMNMEAIEEFLTQAKRIYEMQIEGVQEELRHMIVGSPQDETILKRRFGEYGIGGINIAGYNKFSVFPDTPFYGGYLEGEYEELNYIFAALRHNGFSWDMLPGQNYGACIPVSLLAVNSSASAKEESCLFVEFILSEEFQKEASLAGFPINRKAYLEKQGKNEAFSESTWLIPQKNGDITEIEVSWPTKEEYKELDRIINAVKGVNICENKVYDTVISQGLKVLTEGQSIEEAVDAIKSQLQIYLSE